MNQSRTIYVAPFLLSLWISAVICFFTIPHKTDPADEISSEDSSQPLAGPEPPEPAFPAPAFPAPVFPEPGNKTDIILRSYRNVVSRDRIVSLFGLITKSNEVAAIVLTNADAFDIPPSLAFALCWEESRYNIRAVNRKNRNQSIDRGLFQLNSYSFPQLLEEDFFNPSVNAYYALAHLRWCIDTGGSEISGLAMYNAGMTRVRQDGTPKNTLDYISRVLAYQNRIEEFFRSENVMTISMSPR
ncbi:MAG: lytic transglycosylase domain-containing protein [Treponema sp.]|nr:lytic transglycosylase domain-containing protein [Treponema sp.]